MRKEINLLSSLPKSKRNLESRTQKKTKDIIAKSRKYDFLYFDGPREYGYGGYKYDGRWKSVARDFKSHYSLNSKSRVLDIGCAKGFLVKDLSDELNNNNIFGLDISDYALKNCHPDVIGKLHKGSAEKLPFPDNSFDLVISLDTIHNLPRNKVIIALKEIERVTKKDSFIKVDSYLNENQKKIFENWVLTAKYHNYPKKWLEVFKEAGFNGDYYWTIIE